MSGNEETEKMNDNTTIVTAMGDVLAKKHVDPEEDSVDRLRESLERSKPLRNCLNKYARCDKRDALTFADAPVYNASTSFQKSVIDNGSLLSKESHQVALVTEMLSSESSSESLLSMPKSIGSPSKYDKEFNSCDNYKFKREIFQEELQQSVKFQNLWTELRQHIRQVFNSALEMPGATESLEIQQNTLCLLDVHNIVIELCKRDAHQFFLRLVSLAQEFIVELKVRLLALLHDRDITNLAEIFLIGLLDDYDALVSTAFQISELVKPLKEHFSNLCKFNLTWDCFIKKLYQIYVYNDLLEQNNLAPFIRQLRKLLPFRGLQYQNLVHRYLDFDDEMTKIGNLWADTEAWMDKYNAEQAIRMTRLKQMREAWELYTETKRLMEEEVLNKTSENESESQDSSGERPAIMPEKPNSRAESPDLSMFSSGIPSGVEIIQILLDDWNKARHQNLTDVVRALVSMEMEMPERDDSDVYAYRCATNHLAEFAISTVRDTSTTVCMNAQSSDVGTECECDICTESDIPPAIKEVSDKTLDSIKLLADKGTSVSPTRNGITEEFQKGEPVCETVLQCTPTEDDIETDNIDDCESKALKLQPCSCVYRHVKEIAEKKAEVLINPPCPCLLNSRRKWHGCPCSTKSDWETAESPVVQEQTKSKPTVITESTQSPQPQTRHSTTQTTNTIHNHASNQVECNVNPQSQGPPAETAKNSAPSGHRPHVHNKRSAHACHKQGNIEHIKRVSCNDLSSGDGDCSDAGSSHEHSCSSSSSAQRDSSRHCDCCYCEVFGHGVPSVAPVSRNYNEMRERLRQLLSKKKLKKCKAACSPSESPSESSVVHSSHLTDTKNAPNQTATRSNTPVSTITPVHQPQRDQRDLDALLEFIEGGQSGKKYNNKKAEKKARQKQRKLEEKLQKDKQEADRQRLLELQKKTPDVTITVVDPQKPGPRRPVPQCSLPEVSILPTSSRGTLSTVKQSISVSKKSEKREIDASNEVCDNAAASDVKVKSVTANVNIRNKNTSNKSNKSGAAITNQDCKIRNTQKTGIIQNNDSDAHSIMNTFKETANDRLANILVEEKPLTKKERKKLRREAKKLEEERNSQSVRQQSQPEVPQSQIVTIKRVMESNGAEPTVTITLKGQTPAEDKVLFTLVNGQTTEPTPQKVELKTNKNDVGKKKKNKTTGNTCTQTGSKANQLSNNSKQSQQSVRSTEKNVKNQTTNEKTKKQVEDKKHQNHNANDNKSKKEKKNTENKENVIQQQNMTNKGKNQQSSGKNQNKSIPLLQTPTPKSQQKNVSVSDSTNKKSDAQQQQKKQNQLQNIKNNKNNVPAATSKLTKTGNPKNVNDLSKQLPTKISSAFEVYDSSSERLNAPLSTQFKDISASSKINIETLKLPPGITITKVDAPVRPASIKPTPAPKPISPPKQTTIIATPMTGVQSTYAGPQAGGNVIVVDTGKLKQDLLPKTIEKGVLEESVEGQSNTSGKKKKKKKNKNSSNTGGNGGMSTSTTTSKGDSIAIDRVNEPARIVHNPDTKMVTIRNPAFGPMKVPPSQQAAIIKVSENGMVTIRSPALQQAINAGLTTSPKPNFIVKGDPSVNKMSFDATNAIKPTNGITPSSLAELRSRLTPDCTALSGLANIQISKVTNGQPIPENGINLKGTSVTLTKVRTETPQSNDEQQVEEAKNAVRDAVNASLTAAGAVSISNKTKKKKKRGNGTRQNGDDWNLVESVFTPKDIDLEDGEMDDAERELEAFKRFCLQSVPPPRKEKVNLNIKDIVLKKKSSSPSSSSSSSSSTSAINTVIAAN